MDSLLRLMVGHMYDGVYWWWPFELKTSLVSSVGWINGIILYIFLNPKVKNQKKTIKLTLLLERWPKILKLGSLCASNHKAPQSVTRKS